MDWRKLRERYLKDEWPIRLGNLGSTLGRVAQRAANPDASAAVPLSLRESMLLVEWNLGRTPSEILIELASIQSELRLWWRGWDTVTQSSVLRSLLSRRARQMSDRVLELSGLLESSQLE